MSAPPVPGLGRVSVVAVHDVVGPDGIAAGMLGDAVVELVVAVSADEGLTDATYLPPRMDRAGAVAWLRGCGALSWVVLLDDIPCGLYQVAELTGSIGAELPAGVLEREVWLLEAWRGLGIVRQVTALLAPTLRTGGVRGLVGVAWEGNLAAVRGMRNGGFVRFGRVWWEHPDHAPGWCEAWLLEL
jgi:hypothetical protein